MKLAIKGHPTRGKEIIKLFEMMGGKNFTLDGTNDWYVINDLDNSITFYDHNYINCHEFVKFTLEEFLEKYPFKIGDKVKNARINDFVGEIVNARWDNYEEEVVYTVIWDDMTELSYFAKSLQPYKEKTFGECIEETIQECLFKKEETINKKYNVEKYLKVWKETEKGLEVVVNDNFELKEDNGKFYIIKKQSQYPKTYEECCEVLGVLTQNLLEYINKDCNKDYYYNDLKSTLNIFVSLKICRDAYWKIAGEQMGLGQPWEPDWTDNSDKYFICYLKDEVWMSNIRDCNRLLVFPTPEMQDAFYGNFKDLIEQCKELL